MLYFNNIKPATTRSNGIIEAKRLHTHPAVAVPFLIKIASPVILGIGYLGVKGGDGMGWGGAREHFLNSVIISLAVAIEGNEDWGGVV